MENYDEVNVWRLVAGIAILSACILATVLLLKDNYKNEHYNSWTLGYDIEIFAGLIGLTIVGGVLVYRELSKIGLMALLMIFTTTACFSQTGGCADIKKGTFNVYDGEEIVGRFYRKDSLQLEDNFDGKKMIMNRLKEKDCIFYISSTQIRNELDTITMKVNYYRTSLNKYSFVATPAYLNIDYEYKGEIVKIDSLFKPDVLKLFKDYSNKSSKE